MTTQFHIVLSVKTINGPESFARFFIGNNRDRAYKIFSQMIGTEADEKNVLYVDLTETKKSLPVNVRMITCTLDELTDNCRILTREIFKLLNLEKTESLY